MVKILFANQFANQWRGHYDYINVFILHISQNASLNFNIAKMFDDYFNCFLFEIENNYLCMYDLLFNDELSTALLE